MNTTIFLEHVEKLPAQGGLNMQPDGSERVFLGEHEEVEVRISRGRLNNGFDWSLFYHGQLVQTRWAETRTEARSDVAAFAKLWAEDKVEA